MTLSMSMRSLGWYLAMSLKRERASGSEHYLWNNYSSGERLKPGGQLRLKQLLGIELDVQIVSHNQLV